MSQAVYSTMTTERRKCDGALERSPIQQKPAHTYLWTHTRAGPQTPVFPEPYYHILENAQHCLDWETQTLNAYQMQIENVHERSSMSTGNSHCPAPSPPQVMTGPWQLCFLTYKNKTKQKYGFLCEIFQGKSTKWHPAINQYIEWTSTTTVNQLITQALHSYKDYHKHNFEDHEMGGVIQMIQNMTILIFQVFIKMKTQDLKILM